MHVKQHILKYAVLYKLFKENKASEECGCVLTYATVTFPRQMCNLKFFPTSSNNVKGCLLTDLPKFIVLYERKNHEVVLKQNSCTLKSHKTGET
jgi:hypothetical protein